MSIVNAANGHSQAQERNVANILYISIIAAVVVGMIAFFWMGQRPSLDTTKNTPSATSQE
jgi:flagellar basal body-associated protein FliL